MSFLAKITDGTEVSGGYPYYWNGTTSNKINFQVSSLSLKKRTINNN